MTRISAFALTHQCAALTLCTSAFGRLMNRIYQEAAFICA
jgi:hypothetical protein